MGNDYLGYKFIYALIVMSMMRPAEKFLRNLFGMDKGKIANTGSYESGKQLIDAVNNAIKQTVMTVATVAGIVATGGAAAGAVGAKTVGAGATGAGAGATGAGAGATGVGAGGGVNGAMGSGIIPGAGIEGTQMAAEGSPIQSLDSQLGTREIGTWENAKIEEINGSRKLTFSNRETPTLENANVEEINGTRRITFPKQDAQQDSSNVANNGRVQQVSSSEANNRSARHISYNDTNGAAGRDNSYNPPEIAKESLSQLLNGNKGKTGTYWNANNMNKLIDVYDSLDAWRHSIGDIGRAFGTLGEGAGGKPPMRMAPFIRNQINKEMEEATKRFAEDGTVQNYFYSTNYDKYFRKYKGRNTIGFDNNGNAIIDEAKLEEDMRGEAKKDAEKASQYLKYGFNDVAQIDRMMKLGKEGGKYRPEDVVPYALNYGAAEREMIQKGIEVNGKKVVNKDENEIDIRTEVSINSVDVQKAIKESLNFLQPGQNIVGAQIINPGEKNSSRVQIETLNNFAKLANELKKDNVKLSHDERGDVQIIYNLIETAKTKHVTDVNNISNANNLPVDIKEFINKRIQNP